MIEVSVTRVVNAPPGGTIVVLEGKAKGVEHPFWFAADWRMAGPIIEALGRGQRPLATIEPWQAIGIAYTAQQGHTDARFALVMALIAAAVTAFAFHGVEVAVFLIVAALAVRFVPADDAQHRDARRRNDHDNR